MLFPQTFFCGGESAQVRMRVCVTELIGCLQTAAYITRISPNRDERTRNPASPVGFFVLVGNRLLGPERPKKEKKNYGEIS